MPEDNEQKTLCEVWGCDMEPTYHDPTVVELQCTRCGATAIHYLYQ